MLPFNVSLHDMLEPITMTVPNNSLMVYSHNHSGQHKLNIGPPYQGHKTIKWKKQWVLQGLLYFTALGFLVNDLIGNNGASTVLLGDLQILNDSHFTSVNSYLALKETESSKEIADATMRDSSAMKSIGVLAMVSLFATFVAVSHPTTSFHHHTNTPRSILDTPVFSFTAGDHLITTSFWIFWTISIPLTLAVLLLWFLGVNTAWTKWLKSTFRGEGNAETAKEPRKRSSMRLFDMLAICEEIT